MFTIPLFLHLQIGWDQGDKRSFIAFPRWFCYRKFMLGVLEVDMGNFSVFGFVCDSAFVFASSKMVTAAMLLRGRWVTEPFWMVSWTEHEVTAACLIGAKKKKNNEQCWSCLVWLLRSPFQTWTNLSSVMLNLSFFFCFWNSISLIHAQVRLIRMKFL